MLSILSGSKNVSAIRDDTGIHPKTLPAYLSWLSEKGLIKVEVKGWRRGKSKPCSITEAGINWLVNTSMLDVLKVLSHVLSQLRKPENREVFRKVREEKYLQTRNLIINHFIECHRKGIDPFEALRPLDEWEYNHRFRIQDLDEPLIKALRKLYALILFFWSPEPPKEDPEDTINTHIAIFTPGLLPFYMYRPGTRPELDHQLRQIQNEILHTGI